MLYIHNEVKVNPETEDNMALNLATKDRLGVAVIGAVANGADTYHKIRARFPDVPCADLRAAVRHARGHWLPIVTPSRKALIKHYRKLTLTGRRYAVITR